MRTRYPGARDRIPHHAALRWDYQTISCEGSIDPGQRAELEGQGFELFSVSGPVSAEDRRRDHHFRRPIAN
jgi:hypothetical protein